MSTEHASKSPLNANLFGMEFDLATESHTATRMTDANPSDDLVSTRTSSDEDRKNEGEPQSIDSVEFRVIRTGSPVRRLRLTGNRYTFGSAEGCSIRLSDQALRPMHAVLIRDRIRVLVRAYSVPIEVNGIRKTESALQVGDVMRLGTYQFELVSISTSRSGETESHYADTSSGSWLGAQTSVLDEPPKTDRPAFVNQRFATDRKGSPSDPAHSAAASSKSLLSKSSGGSSKPGESDRAELPSAEDVIWRERLRREIDQWRERQVDCDQREQRIEQRESTLRGRETELWSRAENLHRRETRLQTQESSMLQLHDDYIERQQDLIDLKQQAQTHQQELDRREFEFHNQEIEYRGKLEEASRQLHQSRQQAESATQAVSRMREQFDSLNQQIEDLSTQQQHLSDHEGRQIVEHQKLRDDLSRQRDEAINAKADSETRRKIAEARVEEMASQLEAIRADSDDDHALELAANETLIADLREKIGRLQSAVAEASEESARLRVDYEEACETVSQLESLVAQSSSRGDEDRESWIAEADELRGAIDQLSLELARANGEVARLSEANVSISDRLQLVQTERDEAKSRPTHEAFETLRSELDSANVKLSEMKSEYAKTLERLAIAEELRRDEKSRELESREQPKLDQDQNRDDAWSRSEAQDEEADVLDDVNQDDVWPTYQLDDPDTDTDRESEQKAGQDWPQQSDEADSHSHWQALSAWQEVEYVEADDDDASGFQLLSPEQVDDDKDDQRYDSRNENDSSIEDERPLDGSLASLLIKDLDADHQSTNLGHASDRAHDEDLGRSVEETFLMAVDDVADRVEQERTVMGWNRDHADADVENHHWHEPKDSSELLLENHQDERFCDDEMSYDEDEVSDGSDDFDDASDTPDVINTVANGDDDDSIEAYMNRLLNRVQAAPETLDATKPQSISLSTPAPATSTAASRKKRADAPTDRFVRTARSGRTSGSTVPGT